MLQALHTAKGNKTCEVNADFTMCVVVVTQPSAKLFWTLVRKAIVPNFTLRFACQLSGYHILVSLTQIIFVKSKAANKFHANGSHSYMVTASP